MTPEFSTRDQSEIERSASEASKIVVKPVDVDRYLNPQANTPFALEYAFYLLGNVQGKVVLDLGCGSGETLIPLIRRGASLIGIDLSPDLIAIARRRLSDERLSATTYVGSAYETNLSNNSVDVIFCMSLIHHLDIATVREEMRRILRPGGCHRTAGTHPLQQGLRFPPLLIASSRRHFRVRTSSHQRRIPHRSSRLPGRGASFLPAPVRSAATTHASCHRAAKRFSAQQLDTNNLPGRCPLRNCGCVATTEDELRAKQCHNVRMSHARPRVDVVACPYGLSPTAGGRNREE